MILIKKISSCDFAELLADNLPLIDDYNKREISLHDKIIIFISGKPNIRITRVCSSIEIRHLAKTRLAHLSKWNIKIGKQISEYIKEYDEHETPIEDFARIL